MNVKALKVIIPLAAVAIVAAAILIYVYHGAVTSEKPPVVYTILGDAPRSIRVHVGGLTGGKIPVNYTCDASKPVPPSISWSSVAGAKSYVIVVVDPDAPMGPFIHLVAYDGASTHWPSPDYKLGVNTAGRLGWFPVCPPRHTKPHRYYFIVIALDEKLGLGEGAALEDVMARMRGHVLAYGYVIGVYSR